MKRYVHYSYDMMLAWAFDKLCGSVGILAKPHVGRGISQISGIRMSTVCREGRDGAVEGSLCHVKGEDTWRNKKTHAKVVDKRHRLKQTYYGGNNFFLSNYIQTYLLDKKWGKGIDHTVQFHMLHISHVTHDGGNSCFRQIEKRL